MFFIIHFRAYNFFDGTLPYNKNHILKLTYWILGIPSLIVLIRRNFGLCMVIGLAVVQLFLRHEFAIATTGHYHTKTAHFPHHRCPHTALATTQGRISFITPPILLRTVSCKRHMQHYHEPITSI